MKLSHAYVFFITANYLADRLAAGMLNLWKMRNYQILND
jgi:hypothetical protein